MKIFVIIPGYNEGSAIGKVIKDLIKAGYTNVIVVDDGSKDDTGKVAYDSGATVLTHIINRGQGAALKTGNLYALENDAEIIVHFDADGQMQVSDIKAMCKPIVDNKVDMTIGSRFLGKAENIDSGKKIMLKLARFVVYILYGLWLTDSQNGFRVMNRKAAKKIEINSDRMEHAGEILGEIKKKKIRFKEVPVTIKYTDYSMGKGQHWTRSFSLGVRMLLRWILKR
ncbi:glycosyltransferase family 2 protein [Candidatus Woesearchaeota archaeon]|nr:MAG: glycosyltransferase family 2 protein [Candidatus Woesearchaeota archaeon]